MAELESVGDSVWGVFTWRETEATSVRLVLVCMWGNTPARPPYSPPKAVKAWDITNETLQKVADSRNSRSHTPGYKPQSLLIGDQKVKIIWQVMHFCFFASKITTGKLCTLVASQSQLSKYNHRPKWCWKKCEGLFMEKAFNLKPQTPGWVQSCCCCCCCWGSVPGSSLNLTESIRVNTALHSYRNPKWFFVEPYNRVDSNQKVFQEDLFNYPMKP